MFDVVQSTPLEPFLAPTSPANTDKTFVKKKQTKQNITEIQKWH